MAATLDYDPYSLPHRRPVGNPNILPGSRLPSDSQYAALGAAPNSTRAQHRHSRTVSSSIFPAGAPPPNPSNNYAQAVSHSRRTSTSSTQATLSVRQASQVSISLRRSTSSRSGQSTAPSSYVALMRKQKATVWCERAQHEDPRLLAQEKAAKLRATMEVVGGGAFATRTGTSGSMGSASLGVRSKIRHHGPKAPVYATANLVGTSGVPMRLSASEVGDEEGSDDDADSARYALKPRTGSGRSSLASGQRLAPYVQRVPGRLSQGSTPPSGQGSSPGLSPETGTAETPVPAGHQRRSAAPDYFAHTGGKGGSGGSGNSERESSFGNVGDMKGPQRRVSERRTADELARRGSVDERSATMRGAVRLFVANPDLSD